MAEQLRKKSSELPGVSQEFLSDSQKLDKIFPKSKNKKGGPYSKIDRQALKNEVYRLHFEYGYSARKIAEVMKVSRNTINGDVVQWYSKILKNTNIFNPEHLVIVTLERFEIQRTRIRERLDKVKNNPESVTLERMIYEIDSKILDTYLKLTTSALRTHKLATEWLNQKLKENNLDTRNITFFDTIAVSQKAHERIRTIINEDYKQHNSR